MYLNDCFVTFVNNLSNTSDLLHIIHLCLTITGLSIHFVIHCGKNYHFLLSQNLIKRSKQDKSTPHEHFGKNTICISNLNYMYIPDSIQPCKDEYFDTNLRIFSIIIKNRCRHCGNICIERTCRHRVSHRVNMGAASREPALKYSNSAVPVHLTRPGLRLKNSIRSR